MHSFTMLYQPFVIQLACLKTTDLHSLCNDERATQTTLA